MTNEQIVAAWRSLDHRDRLTAVERAALPAHPAGESALTELDLDAVIGGETCHCLTLACCDGFTSDPGYCSAICTMLTAWNVCTVYACS
jgi:mersacidin/lichenicidin family type 2 lantibiotic